MSERRVSAFGGILLSALAGAVLWFLIGLAFIGSVGAQAPLSYTALGAINDTTNTNAYTGTSMTTTANGPVIALLNCGTCNGQTVSITCTGITWSEKARVTVASTYTMAIHYGYGEATCTPTVTWSSSTGGMQAQFVQIEGAVQSGDPFVQAVSSLDQTAATSLTVTCAAFADSGNATLGYFFEAANGSFTNGSGFSLVGTRGVATPNQTQGVEFKASNDTTVDMSSGFSVSKSGYCLEIDEYEPPPGTTTTTTTAPGTPLGSMGASRGDDNAEWLASDEPLRGIAAVFGGLVLLLTAVQWARRAAARTVVQ